MQQPNAQPQPRPSMREALEDQLQHVERQAGFAADLVASLRREFASLWAMQRGRDQIDGAEAFISQVDAVAALAARYLTDASRARELPTVQAHRLVRLLDVNTLLARGRGLEAAARAMRINPKVRALRPARTGLLTTPPIVEAAPEPARRLTERLQDALTHYTVRPVEPEPPPQPTSGARRLQAFEGALALVADVLADAGPRLEALRVALAVAEADPPIELAPAAKAAGVPPDLRELLPAAVAALRQGPLARRAAAIALEQWEHAARLAEGYTLARRAARLAPDEHVEHLLAPYDVVKLKGMVVPLTNLHLTFRLVPALAAIFPTPIKRRMELGVPAPDAPPAAHDEAEDAPDEAEAVTPARGPTRFTPAEVSERRMALIVAWMKDPEGDPALRDRTVLYRLLAEEREYQQDQVSDMGMRLRLMPPYDPDEPPSRAAERARYQRGLEAARTRQAQLHELLKLIMAQPEPGA